MVGGEIPMRKLVGGKGNVVGEHEEVEGNLLVCSVGAGVAKVGLPAVCKSSARGAGSGRWWSGEGGWCGEVGEYQQVEADPFRASVWAEEEQKVGLNGEVEWWC
jgi:hypothetical protein